MANTTNLEKARVKLDEAMLNHEGDLYPANAINYLEVIAAEFNLSEEKILELKAFKYQREISQPIKTNTEGQDANNGQSENVVDFNVNETPEPTTEERFAILEEKYVNLVNLLSKVAVLTGNGNHLKEYGIERWVPGKKDMNKYG